MKRIDWFILFFFLAASIFTLNDLFLRGMFTSHDGIHQVVRFSSFDQAIRDGQFPPRWAGNLLHGYGYPLFIFSYHLPWYIAELVHLAGFSIFESVKMTFLIGYFFSGVTMYLFQRDLFGRVSAFTGSFLYLLAPYRFSTVFVRGAIGDATVFLFAPLVFLAFSRLRATWRWHWILVGSIGISGMILSHLMVFLLFFPTILLSLLFFSFSSRRKVAFLFCGCLCIVLGMGLSAYYLFPSVFERQYTQFQTVMREVFPGNYFPTIGELFYSPWGYGVFRAAEGAMSVQIGLAQIFSSVSLLCILAYFLFHGDKKTDRVTLVLAVSFCLAFFFTLLGILPFSSFLWKQISRFVVIDFPWRALSVLTFTASVCGGALVSLAKKYRGIVATVCILISVYANRNYTRINETLPWDLPFFLTLEQTTNTFDEYLPRWADRRIIDSPFEQKVEGIDGVMDISLDTLTGTTVAFTVRSEEGGAVRIHTLYYPGWRVWVNDTLQDISYQNSGLLDFSIPSGESRVFAHFSDTLERTVGNSVSLVTGAFLLAQVVVERKKMLC